MRARLEVTLRGTLCRTRLLVAGDQIAAGDTTVDPAARLILEQYRADMGEGESAITATNLVSGALAPTVSDDLFVLVRDPDPNRFVVIDVVANQTAEPWPWELLAHPDGTKLVLDRRRVLRRVVDGPTAAPPAPGPGGTPLTTVVASGPTGPGGREPLADAVERWVVGHGQFGDPPHLVDGVVGLDGIDAVLPPRGKPPADVLVLVAHGEKQGLLLAGDGGRAARWVSGAELAAVVAGRVRLVALLACQGTAAPDGGTGVAASLARAGVPVVAFNPRMAMGTVAVVSKALTRRLAESTSLHEAVRRACQDVEPDRTILPAVKAALTVWQPTGDDVHLRAPHRAGTGGLLDPAPRPYDLFVERPAVLDEVRRFVADPDRRFLGIVGQPGSGKSKLLRHLVEEPGAAGAPVVAWLLRDPDLGDRRDDLTPRLLTDRVGQALAEVHAGSDGLASWLARRHDLEDMPAPAGVDAEVARWEALVAHHPALPEPRLVVIDALEEAGAEQRRRFGRFLEAALRTAPPGLKFVLSTRTSGFLPDLDGGMGVLDLRGHPDSDAIAAYARWVLDERLADGTLGADIRDRLAAGIAARAAGVFLYARAVLAGFGDDELEALADPDLLDTVVNRLPAGLIALYDDLRDRQVREGTWDRALPLLATICCRLDGAGFSVPELAALLPDETAGTIHAFLRNEPAVTALLTWTGDRLSPFHASLAEWVLEQDGGAARFEAHARLAQGLTTVAALPGAGDSDLARYHVAHTPRHLLEAMGDPDPTARARALQTFADLFDPAFLVDTVVERGPATVAEELDEALAAGSAVRPGWVRVLHGLAMDPGAWRDTRTPREVSDDLLLARNRPAWRDTRTAVLTGLELNATFAQEAGLRDWAASELGSTVGRRLAARASSIQAPGTGTTSFLRGGLGSLAWGPQGYLAAATRAGYVHLFRFDPSGRLTPSSDATSLGPIRGDLLWGPGGYLAACTGDQLHVFRLEPGGDLTPTAEPLSIGSTVWSAAWGPEGTLAVGGETHVQLVRVDSIGRPERVGEPVPVGSGPELLAWSPSGLLATATLDGDVHVLHLESNGHLARTGGPTALGSQIWALAWGPSERLGVTTGDAYLHLFRLDQGGRLVRDGDPTPTGGTLTRLAWGLDGHLAAIGAGGNLHVYEFDANGDPVPSGEPTFLGSLFGSLSWGPDGHLAVGTFDGGLHLFHLDGAGRPTALGDPTARPQEVSVAWLPGGHLVVGASEGTLRTLRLEPRDHLTPIGGPTHLGSRSPSMAGGPQGHLVVGDTRGSLHVFNLDPAGGLALADAPVPIGTTAKGMAFGPPPYLVVAGSRNEVHLFECSPDGRLTPRGQPIRLGTIHALNWGADQRLAVASLGQLHVFEVAPAGHLVQTVDPVSTGALYRSLAWGPDGYLAAGKLGELHLWRLDPSGSLSPVGQRMELGSLVNAIAWGPARHLVAGTERGDLHVLRLSPDGRLATITSQPLGAPVASLAWGPDEHLAVGTTRGWVLFRLTDGP